MLIDVVSDLHLRSPNDLNDEFYTASAPVLALLGDVCEMHQLETMLPVFERISGTWKKVLYVLGNHEFYNGFLDNAVSHYRSVLSGFKNIHILDNDAVSIRGIAFIGSTLWSDMDRNSPITKNLCRTGISDYRLIYPSLETLARNRHPITPDHTVHLFSLNIKFLEDMLTLFSESKKIVMLTHHAPSYQSVIQKFRTNMLNGAFVSNLDHIMLNDSRIKLWLHGHCHSNIDYMVEQCRVVCHPKGYGRELYEMPQGYRPLTVKV